MAERARMGMYAGVVDSTAASMASFLIGLVAIWTLSQSELGVYAVFFSAFLTASYLPRQFRFVPVEMASVDLPRPLRSRVARRSLVAGLIPCSAAAALTIATIPIVSGMGDRAVVVPLAVTTALATLVSPLQDHTRRLLHLAGRSWQAGWISLVQLGVVGSLALLAVGPPREGVPSAAWMPMGILSLANLASLIFAVVLVGRGTDETRRLDLSMARLRGPGLWLGGSALATKGSGFAASALIGNLAGAPILGLAEAARVAAQPVMVLGIGLQDAVSARLMEAGASSDPRAARAGHRAFFRPLLWLGLAYLVVSSFPWAGNPMSLLVPSAYEVQGLVAVTVLANLAMSAAYPYRLQLLGAARHRTTALIEALSSVAPVALALSVPATQAFARPLGLAAQGVAQLGPYHFKTQPERASASDPDLPVPAQDRP